MTRIVLAVFLLTAGFACKHKSHMASNDTTYERNTASTVRTEVSQGTGEVEYKDVDNTAMNKRDADGRTLTPMDQSKGSKNDLEITRKVREVITDEDSLSVSAQNVKIITLKGITTLRGPVESASEKSKVEQLARRAGARNINNQLDITTK